MQVARAALAMLLSHPDGQVREAAQKAMGAAAVPESSQVGH